MDKLSPIREAKLQEVYLCIRGAGEAGATVQDVAKCLKLRVTPYVRDMLDQLIELRWVRKEQGIIETGRGSRMGWRYFDVPEGQS